MVAAMTITYVQCRLVLDGRLHDKHRNSHCINHSGLHWALPTGYSLQRLTYSRSLIDVRTRKYCEVKKKREIEKTNKYVKMWPLPLEVSLTVLEAEPRGVRVDRMLTSSGATPTDRLEIHLTFGFGC